MDDAALTFVARLDDEASAAARGLRGTMDALGGPVDPMTAAVVMEADGIERMVGDVDAAGNRAANEAAAAGDEAGNRFTDGALEGVDTLAAPMAATVAVAGAAAGAALVASLVGAMNIDQANVKLTAQLGLTVEESERLGGVAGSVYANAWGENVGEVNDAVGAVFSSIGGMGTASSAELEDATTKALALADTFEYDVGRSAQIAGQLVRTGLAGDASEAFDLITAASQRVPANIREDLLDAADEYGPFFAALGISGEQAFGALVAGSETGMYGIDKTGDALKELTIRATDMSAASVSAYEAAGLNAEDMAARFLAGGDVAGGALSDLAAGLLGIEDPVARSNAAIGLFGTPLEDLGVNNIPTFLASLTDASGGLDDFEGAADRMTEALGDNASSNIESFKRQVGSAATEFIGGKLLPVVEDVAKALATNFGPALTAVTGFLSENREVVGFVATYLGTFVGGILLLVGALKAWAAIQAILNVVMSANPIGIIIVAIAALIAAIIYIATQTTWFQDIWAVVWGAIQAAVDAVVSWWNDTAVPLLKKGFDFVMNILRAYIAFWQAVWNGIVTAVEWAVRFVVAVITTYVNIWRAIITAAVDGIKAVIGWFGNLPGLFAGWWDAAVGAVSSAWGRIVGAVQGIVSGVRDTLAGMASAAYNMAVDVINGLVNGIRNGIARVKDAVKNIANAVTGTFKNLLGIASPSKVFGYFARMTTDGYVNDLEDGTTDVERAAQAMADAAMNPLEAASKWSGNLVPEPVSVSGRQDATTTVTVNHVVTSPDGSVREYTAQELAQILAADPSAAGIVEGAVRTATRTRDARTLVASNGAVS